METIFEETDTMDATGLSRIIRARRSVYADRYEKKQVSPRLLENILTDAIWAPTHKMTEPWRFIVLQGEALIDYGKYMAVYYHDRYAHIQDAESKNRKKKYFLDYPVQAACMVAVILQRSEPGLLPEWEEIAAVGCAVQNMALSCTASGLGSYWATGGSAINYVTRLGLQENEQSLGLFFIGYPAKNYEPPQKKRRPLAEKVSWVGTP